MTPEDHRAAIDAELQHTVTGKRMARSWRSTIVEGEGRKRSPKMDWQPTATTAPKNSRECLVWIVPNTTGQCSYAMTAHMHHTSKSGRWHGPYGDLKPAYWCEIVGPDGETP